MNKLNELIKIADIHANKIELAIQRIKHAFPFTAAYIQTIPENELLWIELLLSRFAKLQDFIGRKIIDAFFENKKEITDDLTMIDKLNKLERLGVIEDISIWQDVRDVRNHLTHEYPNHPELTAKYLNQMFALAPKLLLFLDNIKKKISE